MLRRNTYIGLLCFIPFLIFCQSHKRTGDPKNIYTRILAGPTFGFYNNNTFHASNTRAGTAFFVGALEEARIYSNLFASAGLEYQYHSIAFNSYYMTPGYQNLYNQKFDYNYNLKMQEGRLNILLRLTTGTELTKPLTGYIEGGYVLRYLISTQMKVTSNLNNDVLFNGTTHPEFEGTTIKNSFSSGLKVNVGLQHNFLRSHRAWFIQISYMQGLARFLVHENFTPTSLYIKSSFLQIGLGFKF
ncbi:MAG TPA: hypothetical protein VK835_05815 [Bacteroidia bacterium]|nr:hypothetical protein [Bacteroidia bacterium]